MAIRGDRTEVAHSLRRIPIFETLSERNLELLGGLLSRREVDKGETLYREGQPCERFIIVVAGRFNVLKTSADGREKVVAEILPKHHFGLAEIITGHRSGATVEATEDSVVLTLLKEDFVRTLLENPRMSFQLMQTMAATIIDLSDQIQEVSFERVSVRLARLLMELADREGSEETDHVLIQHKYSHQELARRLGTSRETVTRMLKRFKEMGLISMAGRRLVVEERDGLTDVVDRGGIESEVG
jgi:CRP/FNR family transcriptional regulator